MVGNVQNAMLLGKDAIEMVPVVGDLAVGSSPKQHRRNVRSTVAAAAAAAAAPAAAASVMVAVPLIRPQG